MSRDDTAAVSFCINGSDRNRRLIHFDTRWPLDGCAGAPVSSGRMNGRVDMSDTAADAQHIVVVDDYHDIRALVGQYLEKHGYRVSLADGGPALRAVLAKSMPDLVVLDIMMPGEDGLTLCRDIRAAGPLPVIFLTAVADDTDRIIGLEVGADDYLVKPFNPRELLARIRSVLRRTGAAAAQPQAGQTTTAEILCFGPWTLELKRREMARADGVSVPLSTAEFRLLKVFLDHPGHVLSRDQLLDLTVGRRADPLDRSIDNQVSRLRRKLEDDPRSPSMILTHRGGGYSLCADVRIP